MKKIVTDTKLQKLGRGTFKASVVLIELCLFNLFRWFHYFVSGGGRRYSITAAVVSILETLGDVFFEFFEMEKRAM